uniref:Putative conserved secreted protein n=1 Tax=Lutzomyia longipalpis TaxID=7200 RepID=A0A1B0CD62_LUTLO
MLWKFSILSMMVLLACAQCSRAQECFTPKIYSEIGCKPVLEEEDGEESCPKRFDCDTVLGRKGNGCFFQGVAYNDGDEIPQNLTRSLCQASCLCRNGIITCASIECPDLFGPYMEGCIPQNSMDSCCPEEYVCAENDIEKLPKCYMNGNEYRAGESMYPERESCYTCICAEGFDNTTKLEENPHCSPVECGIELHSSDRVRTGCTPIYYKTPTCCPIGWRCPESSDAVIEGKEHTNEDPNMECTFGELKLKIGHKLSAANGSAVECQCSVPPMVTCIQAS